MSGKKTDRGFSRSHRVVYDFAACLALAALVFIVYGGTYGHGFVKYDDDVYITDNVMVQKGFTADAVAWAFSTGHAGNWHPVTWLSHMLDYRLFGLHAGRHHLMSAALHAVNALLLFLVLRLATGMLFQSLVAAAFFAVHPLHVESVAWVAERKDVLSALFWMLTLAAYIVYTRRLSILSRTAVTVIYALGLMAKPMLVTLPFILLLLDYWPLRRFSPARSDSGAISEERHPNLIHIRRFQLRRLIIEKIPLFVIALVSSAVTLAVQSKGGAVGSIAAYPFSTRAANAFVSYIRYIVRTVRPVDLAVFYPYSRDSTLWLKAAGAGIIVIVVTAAVIRYRRKHPFLFTGWLWYIGTLVPVIGLVQVGSQAMADRYMYIPQTGLFIMAAWGIPSLVKGRRYAAFVLPAATAVLLVACTVLARGQVRTWCDTETLFGHAIESAPGNYLAHNNLGMYYYDRGRLDDAAGHFRKAIGCKPDYAEAHNNLGNVFARLKRPGEAEEQYRASLRLKPDFARTHHNLGNVLAAEGKTDEALEEYHEALKLDPDLADTHFRLAALYRDRGDLGNAAAQFEETLRIEPERPEALFGLANILVRMGRLDEAVSYYTSLLRFEPEQAETHHNLAGTLVLLNRLDEAVAHYREALRIAPDYNEAKKNLNNVLRAMNE